MKKETPDVVITRPILPFAIDELKQHARVSVHDKPGSEGPWSEDELIERIGDARAVLSLLSDPITRRVLQACPNLKIVAQYAVGVDNIDLDAAKELGIAVTHTPGVLTDSTADMAFTLLLATARNALQADQAVRTGAFKRWETTWMLGTELRGKTLGIVGMGRIGQAMARRALGFGMKICYSDRTPLNPSDERILNARFVSFNDLLGQSDILSLHCPLTPETHHLLDTTAFERIKQGAMIINTARGPIVDEAALVKALQSGHLAGAGLDVFEQEPSVHPDLLSLDNVVLAPHLGSATRDAREAMARMCVESIIAVLEKADTIPNRLV
jgi:D-3-phosphoglycerate dehydrogenase